MTTAGPELKQSGGGDTSPVFKFYSHESGASERCFYISTQTLFFISLFKLGSPQLWHHLQI